MEGLGGKVWLERFRWKGFNNIFHLKMEGTVGVFGSSYFDFEILIGDLIEEVSL